MENLEIQPQRPVMRRRANSRSTETQERRLRVNTNLSSHSNGPMDSDLGYISSSSSSISPTPSNGLFRFNSTSNLDSVVIGSAGEPRRMSRSTSCGEEQQPPMQKPMRRGRLIRHFSKEEYVSSSGGVTPPAPPPLPVNQYYEDSYNSFSSSSLASPNGASSPTILAPSLRQSEVAKGNQPPNVKSPLNRQHSRDSKRAFDRVRSASIGGYDLENVQYQPPASPRRRMYSSDKSRSESIDSVLNDEDCEIIDEDPETTLDFQQQQQQVPHVPSAPARRLGGGGHRRTRSSQNLPIAYKTGAAPSYSASSPNAVGGGTMQRRTTDGSFTGFTVSSNKKERLRRRNTEMVLPYVDEQDLFQYQQQLRAYKGQQEQEQQQYSGDDDNNNMFYHQKRNLQKTGSMSMINTGNNPFATGGNFTPDSPRSRRKNGTSPRHRTSASLGKSSFKYEGLIGPKPEIAKPQPQRRNFERMMMRSHSDMGVMMMRDYHPYTAEEEEEIDEEEDEEINRSDNSESQRLGQERPRFAFEDYDDYKKQPESNSNAVNNLFPKGLFVPMANEDNFQYKFPLWEKKKQENQKTVNSNDYSNDDHSSNNDRITCTEDEQEGNEQQQQRGLQEKQRRETSEVEEKRYDSPASSPTSASSMGSRRSQASPPPSASASSLSSNDTPVLSDKPLENKGRTKSPRSGKNVVEATQIRWSRGKVIGSGTFGDVYLALDCDSGKQFAVKRISKAASADPSQRTKLQCEIMVMKDLVHENIVQYLGSCYDRGYLEIFLEYVTGGSLSHLIKNHGALGPNLCAKFTNHITNGIKYLHDNDIIHRDIKCANVLVTDEGVAKLADFGCSKQLELLSTNDETLRSIRGSIPWMSPECIRQSGMGKSSDIWSLGCTVLEMITAKCPWPDLKDHVSALFHIGSTTTPPPIPEKIDGQPIETLPIHDFLMSCFYIEPSQRATATELLQHPFISNIKK